MTSIFAIAKHIEGERVTIWGADSQVSKGLHRSIAKNNFKYVEFAEFTVLFAGNASVQHIFEDFKYRKWKKVPEYFQMRHRRDFHRFAADITEALRKKLKDLGAPEEDGHDFQLLVVTPSKLFESDWWAFVQESDIVTGGSGGPLLQAILMSSYNEVTSREELLRLANKAIETTCQIDVFSGPPIIVKEFKRGPNVQSV